MWLRGLGTQCLDDWIHAGSWQPFCAMRTQIYILSLVNALTKEESSFSLVVD